MEQNNISVKTFAHDFHNLINTLNLDIELNVMNYKEFKFNFIEKKFEITQKSILPIINGIGNVDFSNREQFKEFNLNLFTQYEQDKILDGNKLGFKIRYTPLNRHFIAGDKLEKIENLSDFNINNLNQNVSIEMTNNFSLVIFTTPLHFNYNPDLIKKLKELDELNKNYFKIYLIFLTDETENKEYDELCFQFINHYKFENLKYFRFDNNEINRNVYKLLNLQFDLTDPSKFCFFINKENLIISDFTELSDEKFKNIKQTVMTDNDDYFLNKIKTNKRFNHKIKEDENEIKSKFSHDECKNFNHKIKNFSLENVFKNKKNNFITIQIRKYFDINKDNFYTNEKVEKISILWNLSKQNLKIYEEFLNFAKFTENMNKNIFNNGAVINHREKLINTLKIIKDEIIEQKLEDNLINNNSIEINFNIKSENGVSQKNYNLENKIDLQNLLSNEDYIEPITKLSELENELNKDYKSPSFIFKNLFLIPRLNKKDKYIPIRLKYLSNLSEDYPIFNSNNNQTIAIEKSDKDFLIFYFFTSWSGSSMMKLKELNKLSEENTSVRIVGISVDSNYEELKENLILNIFENLSNIKFEIYFANSSDKNFEVFQKVYRSLRVNNNLVIIDKNGEIAFIENVNNVKNLNEKIKNVFDENMIKKSEISDKNLTKNQVNENINNKILKEFNNFYKTHFNQLNYSHDIILNYNSRLLLNDNFEIDVEKVNLMKIKSELRIEEDQILQNFINNKNILNSENLENERNIIETVDLSECLKLSEKSKCSNCEDEINDIKYSDSYYCYNCNNLTCPKCQPEHKHNLILFRTQNKNELFYNKIDKIRLGEDLCFYGSMKSRGHQAGCNKCENIINNMARFICLNCLPGKTPLQTGFNDYCEECIKRLIEKWGNSKQEIKQDENEEHDEINHLYLRLDYAVTYFGY